MLTGLIVTSSPSPESSLPEQWPCRVPLFSGRSVVFPPSVLGAEQIGRNRVRSTNMATSSSSQDSSVRASWTPSLERHPILVAVPRASVSGANQTQPVLTCTCSPYSNWLQCALHAWRKLRSSSVAVGLVRLSMLSMAMVTRLSPYLSQGDFKRRGLLIL